MNCELRRPIAGGSSLKTGEGGSEMRSPGMIAGAKKVTKIRLAAGGIFYFELPIPVAYLCRLPKL